MADKLSRTSGEHMLTSAQMIAKAVAEALSQQLPHILDKARADSDDSQGIRAVSRSLEGLHAELKAQTSSTNARLDRMSDQLAEGTTKFALHGQIIDQHEDRLDAIHDRLFTRSGSSTALQRSLRARGDAPIISTKAWNALLIAAIAALGTGAGTYVVDLVRSGQKSTSTSTPLPIAPPKAAPAP